jgi:hypothetical protein
MAGKTCSASTGLSVWARAAASPTQPVAGPVRAKGRLKVAPETWRTPAMARIGESAARRCVTVVSISGGAR